MKIHVPAEIWTLGRFRGCGASFLSTGTAWTLLFAIAFCAITRLLLRRVCRSYRSRRHSSRRTDDRRVGAQDHPRSHGARIRVALTGRCEGAVGDSQVRRDHDVLELRAERVLELSHCRVILGGEGQGDTHGLGELHLRRLSSGSTLTHGGVRDQDTRIADAAGLADGLKVEQKACVLMLIEHHRCDLFKLVDPRHVGRILTHECPMQLLDLLEHRQLRVGRRDLIVQIPELDKLRAEYVVVVKEADDAEQKDDNDKFDWTIPTHSCLPPPTSMSGSWSPVPVVPGPPRPSHRAPGTRRCAHPLSLIHI